MKTTIVISLLIILASCNPQSDTAADKEKKDLKKLPIIYPETFFTVDNQLYYSDGRRFYCSFKNWEQFYELRGNKKQPQNILAYKKKPEDMKFIKECNLGIITKKFFE